MLEELLRLDGPVQVIDRFASRPTTLAGRDLGPGTKVTAVVGSADRDADVFAAPDEARPDRPGPHMAFGAGVHLCVGAPLARLVAPVALHELFASAPQIELDGEAQWQTDPYLRAVISLPLALGRAADERRPPRPGSRPRTRADRPGRPSRRGGKRDTNRRRDWRVA